MTRLGVLGKLCGKLMVSDLKLIQGLKLHAFFWPGWRWIRSKRWIKEIKMWVKQVGVVIPFSCKASL